MIIDDFFERKIGLDILGSSKPDVFKLSMVIEKEYPEMLKDSLLKYWESCLSGKWGVCVYEDDCHDKLNAYRGDAYRNFIEKHPVFTAGQILSMYEDKKYNIEENDVLNLLEEQCLTSEIKSE